jgi:hypothetical protein
VRFQMPDPPHCLHLGRKSERKMQLSSLAARRVGSLHSLYSWVV